MRDLARGAISLAFLVLSFTQALGQGSDNAALREHVARGNLLMQHHQYSQALEEYESAKSLDPKNSIVLHNIAECHNNWGIACFRLKNYDEAVTHFTKTLSMDQRHNQARYNLEICRRAMAKEEPLADKVDGDSGKTEKKAEKPGKPEASAGKIVITGAARSAEPVKSESKTLFGSFSGGGPQTSVSTVSTYAKPDAEQQAVKGLDKPGEAAANSSQATIIKMPANPVSAVILAKPSEFSLEDNLSTLELKVYGKKQDDLTVIKRLEKLEMETSGQAGSGSISERIQQLRKNIGM